MTIIVNLNTRFSHHKLVQVKHESGTNKTTSGRVPDQPNIWSDGSRLKLWAVGCLRTFQLMYSTTSDGDMRRTSMATLRVVPTILRGNWSATKVQRAEHWGVMLALQVFFGIHIGQNNLNVHGGVA